MSPNCLSCFGGLPRCLTFTGVSVRPPAAVGVDIGCGMMAVQTSLNARDLPDNLHGIREAIEKAVPHGRTNHGGAGDKGAWHEIPADNQAAWGGLKPRYDAILAKH